MERPFFAIAKGRRTRPIEYAESRADGSIAIRIDGKPGVGIATIWDHDVMLWATSQIVDRLNRGHKPSPRLRFAMNELLRAIGRTDARGKAQATRYEELRAALERLRTTSVVIVATERRRDYAEAARAAGAGPIRLARHLVPASFGFLAVEVGLLIPALLIAEGTLSFLGLGFDDPQPSWGTLLQEAANVTALGNAPWLLAPAVAMFVVVLGVQLVTSNRPATSL